MPKASKQEAQRHKPLSEEYQPSQPYKVKATKKRKSQAREDEEHYIDATASRKILKIGQELAEEADEETRALRQGQPTANKAFDFESRFPDDVQSDEDEEEGGAPDGDDEDAWGDELEDVEQEEVDPNDLDIFNKFNPSYNPTFDDLHPGAEAAETSGGGTNLADLILAKIAEHEAGQTGGDDREIHGGGDPEDAIEIPAKVVEVYTKIGLFLSRYKSGKLPKPFKILPTVAMWPTLVSITRPDAWTPNAVYEATRLFVSAKPHVTQPFLTEILLPAVRHNIHETHKLNVHLYNALKKALYKPAAWFKGILFPLLQDGSCSQREAHILASVLARVSVPVLHSAAALNRLCDIAAQQMAPDPDAAGPTNIFIKTLLEKKYALPYKVVDALVFHFLRFRAVGAPADAMDTTADDNASKPTVKLPVIWHQGLLAFAQRYRNDITEDQREALLDLLLSRGHPQIGPEVRRELLAGRGRGVPAAQAAAAPNQTSAGAMPASVGDGGDDTMMMM